MEGMRAEVHQVGGAFVHLVSQPAVTSGEFLGLIEGGGVCLAHSFPTMEEVDQWLHHIFEELFPKHHCDLGCIRMPRSEFLADKVVLERLAGLDRSLPQ